MAPLRYAVGDAVQCNVVRCPSVTLTPQFAAPPALTARYSPRWLTLFAPAPPAGRANGSPGPS